MAKEDIKFRKTSNTTYAKTLRGYTGTITVQPNGSTVIAIDPGAITTSHATIGQAKNRFRKFLFDK